MKRGRMCRKRQATLDWLMRGGECQEEKVEAEEQELVESRDETSLMEGERSSEHGEHGRGESWIGKEHQSGVQCGREG